MHKSEPPIQWLGTWYPTCGPGVCAGIGTSIDMWHIKHHYFTSHPQQNYYAIVPVGGKAWWEEPHDRETKFPQKA